MRSLRLKGTKHIFIDTQNTMNSSIKARVEIIFYSKESKIVPYVAL